MNLSNQIIIISGGASGLGAATAALLAQANATIIIFDKDFSAAQVLGQQIKGFAYAVDVTDEQSISTALSHIKETIGIPRICINCAGIANAKKLVGKQGAMPLSDFQRVIDINLIGTFNMMRLFAELVCQLEPLEDTQERGVIINTSSIAAYEGQIGQVAYAASKGAIVSMTLPAARELAQHAIRVMTIAPGVMHTPLMNKLGDDIKLKLSQQIPFPSRLGDSSEYALLVKHIIENTYLNGSVIRLDGGLRMPLN